MIKFFKKIRQNLLTENKFSKYMLYAIGEIVLVVVGILIALQINNWNQNRLAVNEEQAILKNIHTEFLQNKVVLIESIRQSNIVSISGKTIFNLIGKERIEIEKNNVDSLIFNSLEIASFRPSENTISDLLQSGRLQLLRNNRLKDLLHEWSKKMQSKENAQIRAENKIDKELVPYLSINYSMKDVDRYGRLNWQNKTLLKIDKFKIFEDIVFENIFDDLLYRLSTNDIRLRELGKLIDDIIKETESSK